MHSLRITLGLLFCISLAAPAKGSDIDLVTLPKRDTVQLTIYNSEDLTLVKEVRAVTMRRGVNRLQFSWSQTLIDSTSVELRPLQHADQIEVVDTVYLGSKADHLHWNINSEFEGEVLVEVSYFTSGLSWSMDYVAVADAGETELAFQGHVRVFNNSGEEYENAEVRLIVGKINLVQKIADLARDKGIEPPVGQSRQYNKWRRDLAESSFADAEQAAANLGEMLDTAAKKVVKEGVSEYFMFSVEGRETIPNGWSKRMPAVEADQVKFDIVYRLRNYQYGPRPVRFVTWKNDTEHKLGDSPLPDGVIRLFRRNGQDGLSFLGQQKLLYVPIQADIEVNLGTDDLVVYKQTSSGAKRNNFQFDRRNLVTGWDEQQAWIGEIRNYRSKPIQFETRLQWTGDVEVKTPTPAAPFDFRTIGMKSVVAARDRAELSFTTKTHHGKNAMQNRVRLTTMN